MGGQSKADATPLLLFLNFDVMFAILYFSLNLDKGAWPRKILKPEFHLLNSEVVHNAAQIQTTTRKFVPTATFLGARAPQQDEQIAFKRGH